MNDTNEIQQKVRDLPIEFRKRFASHKSKAINRKNMSENEAISYAWQRLGISDLKENHTKSHDITLDHNRSRVSHSWLTRWIRGDLP